MRPHINSVFAQTSPVPAAAVSAAADAAAHVTATSRRVLVVDDHVDSAEMLSMLISAWGHDARTAHDGRSAFDLANAFQPEIMLLDLTLPDIDGVELGRRLRNCPWAASSVLVAVTGWGRPSDREKSRDAGFDAHLVKPVPLDVLQTLIAHADAAQIVDVIAADNGDDTASV